MSLTTQPPGVSLAPRSMDEAWKFAQIVAKSGMIPKSYEGKPEAIMVAIAWGYEVGLGPMQAVQNVAVINGRPSLWGDAALALVRGHPACAGVREGVDGDGDARHGWCEVTRKGEQPQRRTFSVADAKKAGLWGKQGPWQQYPDRMLQLRARGFALRDVFPDALRGVITAEEANDIPKDRDAIPPARGLVMDAPEPSAPMAHAARVDEQRWPIVAPDGTMKEAPPHKWLSWVVAALGHLESVEAVRAWRDTMTPHLEIVARNGGSDDADEAREAIARRIEELEMAGGVA
jgi:hypothetical protein